MRSSTSGSSTPSWPTSKTRDPDNPGGWDLGGVGPIPEGMVAFFIGLVALLIVSRLLGERGS